MERARAAFATVIVAACAGCATIHERRIVQVESEYSLEGSVHHDVARDRIDVRAKLDGDDAVVAVHTEPACTVDVTRYRKLRVRQERSLGGGYTAEVTTFAVAAAVFGASTAIAAADSASCTAGDDHDCINAADLALASVAVASGATALVTGSMVGIDGLRSIDSPWQEEEDTVQGPPRDLHCPTAVSAVPHKISILLPDGTEQSAPPNPDGPVTRIPLGANIRTRFPDGFAARIAIDGRVAGKLQVDAQAE